MDLTLIENLLRLLDQSSANELEVSENGLRIRVAKMPANSTPTRAASHSYPSSAPEEAAAAQIAELLALPGEPVGGERTISAGLVGTFYRAASPDVPPFVVEGENIEDGRTLGLIEAMKTFNPIEADCAGRLKTILVADGTPVSAGTPLFIIETAV